MHYNQIRIVIVSVPTRAAIPEAMLNRAFVLELPPPDPPEGGAVPFEEELPELGGADEIN
jgi:hypothetical protein